MKNLRDGLLSLLMHSIGVNVSGQIASVIAGGLILALVKAMIGG